MLISIDSNNLRTVQEQVEFAVDWAIGGYENSIQDQYLDYEELPSLEGLVEEVYRTLQYVHYMEGAEIGFPLSEVTNMPALFLKSLIAYKVIKTNSGIF